MPPLIGLPEVIIQELPSSVVNKIESGLEFEDSDKNVARMYLDSTFTHPERFSESLSELEVVITFYMYVGARLSNYTIRDFCKKSSNATLLAQIKCYENVIDRPIISLLMSSEGQSGFRSFRIMNGDRGYCSWSFYAENLYKLGKHMERWVRLSAPHLSDKLSYDIYIDSYHIAKVESCEFVSLPDLVVEDFISDVFGRPLRLAVEFEMLKGGVSDMDAFQIKSSLTQRPHIRASSMLAAPRGHDLAVEYVRSQISNTVKQFVNKYKNETKTSTDISVDVILNGNKIGTRDICSQNISFNQSSSEYVLGLLGRDRKKRSGFWLSILSCIYGSSK